jgi:hypothetical protein
MPVRRGLTRYGFIAAALIVPALTGCAGPLHSRPDVFEARTIPVQIDGRDLRVTYVTPHAPRTREVLILFASGDAGYFGVSGAVMEHLAEQQYYLVTYDARQLIAREKKSRTRAKIQEVAAVYDTILADARRSLGVPDTVPVLVTGYSRGANLVVVSAGIDSLKHHLVGAVAMALCPNTDYIETPTPGDPLSSVLVDDQGHLQAYAAIPFAGSLPFAVIQGTKDSYIGAADARRLFGPETPRRRFYAIEGNHSFGGARDTLIRDLDDALAWIQRIARGN